MKQEDYNDIMKTPAQAFAIMRGQVIRTLKECPKCGEAYLGDGYLPCIECDDKTSAKAESNVHC